MLQTFIILYFYRTFDGDDLVVSHDSVFQTALGASRQKQSYPNDSVKRTILPREKLKHLSPRTIEQPSTSQETLSG